MISQPRPLSKLLDPLTQDRLLGVWGQGQGSLVEYGVLIQLVSPAPLTKLLDPQTQDRLLGVWGQGQGSYVEYGVLI